MADEPPIDQPLDQSIEQPTDIEEVLLQQVEQFKNIATRATADYRNLQRESDEKMTAMRKFATEQLLLDLCPLVDYFDSAFQAIPPDQQQQPWLQGVKHIQSYLLQILKNYNVERMETVGKLFDPHLHEAVGEEESDQPEHTILRETQAGFQMHGKVIRHAKVITAKSKQSN